MTWCGDDSERIRRLLYGEPGSWSVEAPRGGDKPRRRQARFAIGALISVCAGALFGSCGEREAAVFVGISVLAASGWWRRRQRAAHLKAAAFERDYPVLLVALASAVRTGLDPLAAVIESARLFPPDSPLRAELDQLRRGIERGATEEGAIARFGEASGHPDVKLFRSAFLLARREGASLGECLHRLAKVTRQRQSFRRKIRSAVAMQKLSAFGIVGCAFVIGVFQWVTNPSAVSLAAAHPVGSLALGGGVGLMVIGLGWMLHLVRGRIES